MMNFAPFVEQIKARFKKDQLSTFDSIVLYESLHLASMGHNDIEGYQIFTPDFIVKDMCSEIGKDVFDFNKTILEPTSGDGAFTTYILQKRLEKIKDNFEIESLRALSTIYSIEMDKELIEKQRNNIFTLVKLFIFNKKINVDDSYFDILKCIITTNFLWAMFNSDKEIDVGLFGTEVAYKMPDAEKGKLKPLDMPVWEIREDFVDYHEEGVDLW
jgi:hypothetical protein